MRLVGKPRFWFLVSGFWLACPAFGQSPISSTIKKLQALKDVSSPCQESWQAEARPTCCRKLLIYRRGAGAFACEPGVTGLLTRAAKRSDSRTTLQVCDLTRR